MSVCLSVRLSVCRVPRPNSWTERPKPKIGNRRMETHHTSNSSKVKVAMSRSPSDRYWPTSREWKVPETPKFVGRFPTPRTITHTSFKVKVASRLMLRPEVRHICQIGRPSNFKLNALLEHEESHHGQRHDLESQRSWWRGYVFLLTHIFVYYLSHCYNIARDRLSNQFFCLCMCVCMYVCVCVSVGTLTVAFLNRSSRNLVRTFVV